MGPMIDIDGTRIRLKSTALCSVPRVTAILDIAGFPVSSPELTIAKGKPVEKGGPGGVFITPTHPSSWSTDHRQLAISALFRMGLEVDVLPLNIGANPGRGGAVILWVRPGGSL